MVFSKVLPRSIMPFAHVHHLLTAHGFRKAGTEDCPIYQVVLQDTSTQTGYQINIPIQIDHQRHDFVKLGKVYLDETENIPSPILQAIYSKLFEIADYMYRVNK